MTKRTRPGQSAKKRPRRPQSAVHTPAQPLAPSAAMASDVNGSPANPPLVGQPVAVASRPSHSARTARPGVVRPSNIPTNYGYVVSDLKRIGITSGVLFAAIIGLSLVMR